MVDQALSLPPTNKIIRELPLQKGFTENTIQPYYFLKLKIFELQGWLIPVIKSIKTPKIFRKPTLIKESTILVEPFLLFQQ